MLIAGLSLSRFGSTRRTTAPPFANFTSHVPDLFPSELDLLERYVDARHSKGLVLAEGLHNALTSLEMRKQYNVFACLANAFTL